MAFRLMRYAVATMQRHLDSGHKRLPLVIPVLFYSGKRSPYPYTTRWLDEFDDPALAKTLYCGEFPLVDVTVIPDDEIMGHRSMAALTLLQKHIHRRDVSELLDKLTLLLLTETLTREQVHCKRAARTVLTGMCYSVGSATRQGSSSLTRFIGQSAMTSRT